MRAAVGQGPGTLASVGSFSVKRSAAVDLFPVLVGQNALHLALRQRHIVHVVDGAAGVAEVVAALVVLKQ